MNKNSQVKPREEKLPSYLNGTFILMDISSYLYGPSYLNDIFTHVNIYVKFESLIWLNICKDAAC